MNVDFPAPEGPIMATSSPLLNFPEIPFRRVLYPARSRSHSLSNHHRTHWFYPSAAQAHSTFAHGAPGKIFHTLYNADFWARKRTSYLFYTSVNVFSCMSWVMFMTFTSWCMMLYLECTQPFHMYIKGSRIHCSPFGMSRLVSSEPV